MKEQKNTRKLILTMVFIILMIFGCVSVSADPDDYYEEEETYAIESYVPEDESEPEETVEGETSEADSTEVETETTEASSEDTTASEPEEEPEPTYRESLPEAPEEDIVIPEAIGSIKEENEPSLFWGFVAWVCLGVGIAVVLAVLLTAKTKGFRGGSKRYSTVDKISGQKRLLNDQYYNKRR